MSASQQLRSIPQLISAVRTRNNWKVNKLVEEMTADEVNGKYMEETALHVACKHSNHEALDLLLSKPGIDVNVRDRSGNTPLVIAYIYGHDEDAALKILGTPHVDVNVEWALLYVACMNNHHQIVSALLAVPDIRVNVRRSSYGLTPIMMSALHCHKEALKFMLEDSRVDLNIKDGNGDELNVLVGKVEGTKEKEECVEMINKERIKREKRIYQKLESAKKSFECPICMELMRPPTRIWMCQFTHMICEGCRDRLNGGNCPTCTTEAVTQRAFMAENLARTIFND